MSEITIKEAQARVDDWIKTTRDSDRHKNN